MESGLRGGGAAVCACIRVFCVSFHVCVCLWELNLPLYVVWPRRNIANIVVKGEPHKKTIQCGPVLRKSKALQYNSPMAFLTMLLCRLFDVLHLKLR